MPLGPPSAGVPSSVCRGGYLLPRPLPLATRPPTPWPTRPDGRPPRPSPPRRAARAGARARVTTRATRSAPSSAPRAARQRDGCRGQRARRQGRCAQTAAARRRGREGAAEAAAAGPGEGPGGGARPPRPAAGQARLGGYHLTSGYGCAGARCTRRRTSRPRSGTPVKAPCRPARRLRRLVKGATATRSRSSTGTAASPWFGHNSQLLVSRRARRSRPAEPS